MNFPNFFFIFLVKNSRFANMKKLLHFMHLEIWTKVPTWGRDTRICIGRVYDRWCAAREEAEREKCSVPRQNKMLRNTYSCSVFSSPLQRRSYRRPSTLTPVPASRVARSRCSDFYQAGAAFGLIWCGLGGIGAIFLPQKNRQKSLNSVTVHQKFSLRPNKKRSLLRLTRPTVF